MAMMTIDEYIASLQNYKAQFGGDVVLLCFDRLLEQKEVIALNGKDLDFHSIYNEIDQVVNHFTLS